MPHGASKLRAIDSADPDYLPGNGQPGFAPLDREPIFFKWVRDEQVRRGLPERGELIMKVGIGF